MCPSWMGRNSGNLNPEIQLAVDSGACRNLYIGVNEDLEDESDYNLIPVEAKDKTKTKENAKSQFLSSGSLPEESDDVSETKNEDLSDDKNEDNSTGLKKFITLSRTKILCVETFQFWRD